MRECWFCVWQIQIVDVRCEPFTRANDRRCASTHIWFHDCSLPIAADVISKCETQKSTLFHWWIREHVFFGRNVNSGDVVIPNLYHDTFTSFFGVRQHASFMWRRGFRASLRREEDSSGDCSVTSSIARTNVVVKLYAGKAGVAGTSLFAAGWEVVICIGAMC